MATDKPKRRLPVIGSSPADPVAEEENERPPWHWVVIGAIATILGWVIVAMLANLALSSAFGEAPPGRGLVMVVHACGFALASFGAGSLVGRFGTTSKRRHSAMGGALAAALGVAMALVSSSGIGSRADLLSWVLILAVLCALGGGAASLGDRVTRRRPRPGD